MITPHPNIVSFQNTGLTFKGNVRLFSKLNLDIIEGGFYFLTGLSGAGKSTLLKLIYMGIPPTSGHLSLFGEDLSRIVPHSIAHIRRKMGIVFQDFRLLPHLTTVENVALPLKVRGVDPRKARQQAKELLAWVGLEDVLNSFPHTLSGGQQQRAAITRAVMGKPKLLLADEPTGNVDEEAARKILYLFEELHKSGTTVILATHNRSFAKEFHHPEIFLKKGQAVLLNNRRSPGREVK
ncbi:MAG: cell division ATP-binding protein FtsE [Alphaproteobacteria bacterium RIFCSPLOWO2_01_FULL_45_8]|nr:MAG: cell division ATP-binding protein FtsE [Alphaproteobacteria bacterium GWB1_45_5]OFW89756.1 MAG: cell division ATP-binding protein FtsE [Alphaproteobacteria bacterium RIFCSPHIGHO2_01_FULL_41_14]OFW96215.1 MAG: cell division ATP-binding protein FtsE [Alphaproteobacteria bacterium RIFCSPLOWO2_01_FULL_45_8]HCI48426.1 cell division ATP-binding protein FtsE [Holosporales bacterium]